MLPNTVIDPNVKLAINDFPDKTYSRTLPRHLVNFLTFPRQLSNSVTFPGFEESGQLVYKQKVLSNESSSPTRRRRAARAAFMSCCRGSEYARLRYSSRNSDGPIGVSRTLQLRCHRTFEDDADDATAVLLLEPCTGVR